MEKSPNLKLFWTLNILFITEWIFFAIGVDDRKTWMLENAMTLLFIAPVVYYYLKGVFSNSSYVMIFIFLVIHTLGAHYTYSLVPYDEWSKDILGTSLNELLGFERNHYDRLVHFMFGLLVFLPLIDLFSAKSPLKKSWLVSYVLLVLAAASTAYELIEWGAAVTFGGETGMAYLGTQGDVWDAHKDIALATLGSFLAIPFLKLRKSEK